jgi:hypothetical protein
MDRYFDFDVLIQTRGDAYCAQVVRSPAGEASAEFKLPFSPAELQTLIQRVGQPRARVRRHDSPDINAAKGFGGALFESVFSGDVRTCFSRSLAEAKSNDAGLRLRLRLSHAPELSDIPWEFLYDRPGNQFLSLSPNTLLVRYLDHLEPVRPLTVKPPIQVLAIVSDPAGYPDLDVETEYTSLKQALASLEHEGLVKLERLSDATLPALQQRLRPREAPCHVLHFIGHGGFDDKAEDGVLILKDRKGRGDPVRGQFIGMLLEGHRPLRLVVLNACEGARTASTDPFAGTAQSLVQQGIPAVIAMQFEITDAAAITFAREFYSMVATGCGIDTAVTEARRSIFANNHGMEWGTPVLYMRSPNGQIFSVEGAESLSSAAKNRQCAEDEARLRGEESERRAEEEAKLRAHDESKRLAEAEANRVAEEALARAEQEARRLADDESKRRADAQAQRRADKAAKRDAEAAAKLLAADISGQRAAEQTTALGEADHPDAGFADATPVGQKVGTLAGPLAAAAVLIGILVIIGVNSGRSPPAVSQIPAPETPAPVPVAEPPAVPSDLTGSLGAGQNATHELHMDTHVSYRITAACDSDCSDLDLSLVDASDNKLAEDLKSDANPQIVWRASYTGVHRLIVSMVTCKVAPCTYAVAFHRQ